jgi:AAA+ ATPase superfamily predicted ATPase
MFIGRANEMKALNTALNRPGFQMAVIYGRRRIGKTTLINQFVNASGCRNVSFVATQRDERDLLEMLGDAVLSSLAEDLQGTVHFDSFEKVFDFIARMAARERVIFCIDEYPYLARECRYMNSLIQEYADHAWKETQLYLILCGSLVSFMRDEVLSENAPLHGRSTLELQVRPMGYRDAAEFVPSYSLEDKAIVYGLTSGVPKYLEQFDDARSLDDNIVEQFFSSGGYFSEEQIHTLVTGDRANPTAFNSIVESIATGHTKYGEISSDVGNTDIAYYLKTLVAAGLLEKRLSGGRPYYQLTDGMVEFWFKYVDRAASFINAGRGEVYYQRRVRPHLHDHMGKCFEEMARQYLFTTMGTERTPFLATEIVEYQNTFKTESGKLKQVGIDLLGRDGKKIVFAGECKFRNQEFDEGQYKSFTDKLSYLPCTNPHVVVFSLGGFTTEVRNHDATLVNMEDMYS